MGVHRCCECDDVTTPAAFCGELVAGDPPSSCNWWPDAYDVSVTFSGKIHLRLHQGVGGCFSSALIPCGGGSPISAGTQYLCTVIDYSWTLAARIFRIAPGIPAIPCSDGECQQVLFEGQCPDEDADAGCDPDAIFYASPCCEENLPKLSGTATRAASSATGLAWQFGGCRLQAGSAQTGIAFERFAYITAACSTSVTDPATCDSEKAARMVLSVRAFGSTGGGQGEIGLDLACPGAGTSVHQVGYFDSPISLWTPGLEPPGTLFGSGGGTAQFERWDVFPLYGFTENICAARPWASGQTMVSEQLVVESPGTPGDFLGFCNTYSGVCVPDGCDADLTGLVPQQDYVLAACPSGCTPPGKASFACHQVIMSATPVGGSA
jgi:hypothetical protein